MNTKIKDALRNIKKEKVSFLSIVVIAAISVCAYLGISFGASAIYDRADRFYKDLDFRDIELTSTMLFDPGDIDDIKGIEGVADAEEIRFVPARASSGEVNSTLTVLSLTDRINKCEVVEGQLPQDPGECALEKELAEKLELSVGDTITVMDNEDKCPEYLTHDTYKITGIVLVADHYAFEHVVPEDRYMMVPDSAFSDEALDGCCMRIVIKVAKPEGISYFADDYKALVADVKARIDSWKDEHEIIRTNDIRQKTDDKLKEAWDDLIEARKELDENSAKVKDGRDELAKAKITLDDAKLQIDEGQKLLESKKTELIEAQRKIGEAEDTLKENKKLLDDSKKILDDGKDKLDEAKDKLDKGAKELVDSYNEAEDLKASVRELIRGKVEEQTNRDFCDSIDWADKRHITSDDLKDDGLDIMEFKVTSDITVDLSKDYALDPKPILKKILAGTPYESSVDLISSQIKDSAEYKDAEKKLKKIRKGLGQWNQGLSDDREGLSEYEKGYEEYQNGKDEYDKGMEKYETAFSQILSGKAECEKGLRELDTGKKELEQAEKEYKDGLAEYDKNAKELDDAARAIEDGEEQYVQGMADYKEGKKKYEDLGSCYYVSVDIKGNAGFVHTLNCADNVSKIAVTFASLFVVLGFLVIYATVGRIVTEDRHLIGTQKALGFFVREILMKYLLFGSGATLVGAIAGVILGYFGIQKILIIAHAQFYVVPDFPRVISWGLTLIVVIAAIILSVLSVGSACLSLLRETSRDLLADPVPKARRKKGNTKQGGSLYGRLIFRNMIFDLPRVLITMISVAGCCVLLGIGFTMKDSIMNAINKQSDSIVIHDMRVNFDSNISADADPMIKERLENAGIEHTPIYLGNRMMETAQGMSCAEFVCVDPDEIDKYFNFFEPDGKTPTGRLCDDGVYLSMKMADSYKMEPGDTFTIYDQDMDPFEVTISGFYEYYCGKDIFITFDAYKKIFGEEIKPNQYWVNTDMSEDELEALVSDIKGYSSIKTCESIRQMYEDNMSALSLVTIVMAVAAAMMAYFVLLNLTNMYLNKKQKELVVMRICGFTVKEVVRYVSLESVVTTIGGIIIGLGLGSLLGDIIVYSVEQTQICFFHQIDLPGWIFSALITLVYAAVIDIIAFRKIPHYKLYDIAG